MVNLSGDATPCPIWLHVCPATQRPLTSHRWYLTGHPTFLVVTCFPCCACDAVRRTARSHSQVHRSLDLCSATHAYGSSHPYSSASVGILSGWLCVSTARLSTLRFGYACLVMVDVDRRRSDRSAKKCSFITSVSPGPTSIPLLTALRMMSWGTNIATAQRLGCASSTAWVSCAARFLASNLNFTVSSPAL